MPKEDYLLKYIEKISRVIAAMLGLKEKGFPEDALRTADETYMELLNFKAEELALMPMDKFLEIIKKVGYTSTYLDIIAQLANETADIYQMQGNIEFAAAYYKKALEIYYLLNEKDKTFSFEREMKIAELKEK
jgi:hypothetical protein